MKSCFSIWGNLKVFIDREFKRFIAGEQSLSLCSKSSALFLEATGAERWREVWVDCSAVLRLPWQDGVRNPTVSFSSCQSKLKMSLMEGNERAKEFLTSLSDLVTNSETSS